MISRIAQAYASLILKNPKYVLVLLISFLLFFGYHAQHFKLDASADSLLLEDDADLKVFRKIQETYPSNDLLIVTFTPNTDLFSDSVLSTLKNLSEELVSVKSVETVFSILDAPLFNSADVDIQEMIDDMPSLSKPDVDRNRAKTELVKSPIYRNLIVSADGKTSALLLSLVEDERQTRLLKHRNNLRNKNKTKGLSLKETQTLKQITREYNQVNEEINKQRHLDIVNIRQIIKPYRKYGILHLGGLPMITDDMVTFVRDDLVVFGSGVLVFLIIILTVIFRKLRWIMLPLISCFYSGLIMIGTLGLIGWKVTVISSNFLALMLIITISMNIHLIVRYLQLQHDHPNDSQFALVQNTIHKMVRPCLYTALTTIMGFSSLVVSDIKPVIDFGWMMSAGLAVTFGTSFLLFPSLLLVIGKTKIKPVIDTEQFLLPAYLARLTELHGNKIVVIALALTVIGVTGINKLRVENSFVNYFSESTEIYKGLKLIDEELGGTTPLEIIIKFKDENVEELTPEELKEMTPEEIRMEREYMAAIRNNPELWFTPTNIEIVKKAHDYLNELPQIGKVLSLASSVRVAEQYAEKELDGMELGILYTKVPRVVKKNLIDPYVSIKNNEVRLLARVLDSKPDLSRKRLLEKVRADLGKEHEFRALTDYKLLIDDITISGLLVLYNNMLQSLFTSQIKTIGVVMLGIALMFLILFRSVKLSIIGILPNALGALAVLGFMGWSKIPMDMMTITIAAITVGIAVDNGIHYIYRFKEEYAVTHNYRDTLYVCHNNIGKAVFYTTMTIIFGFSILMLSNFIPTIYFGLLTGAAMLIALLAALTLLPKFILIWRPFG